MSRTRGAVIGDVEEGVGTSSGVNRCKCPVTRE